MIFSQTTKGVRSPDQPDDQIARGCLRRQQRLYPANTGTLVKQLEQRTVDHRNWYPIYKYPSTYSLHVSPSTGSTTAAELTKIGADDCSE